MVTYGPDAGTIEGDDDFLQVIFIRIPEQADSKAGDAVYLRIFDADCGGVLDARYSKEWDTRTRLRLFGGKDAYSLPGLKKAYPSQADISSGELIADETFGEDAFRDNRWYSFAETRLDKGEKIDNFRYFKLIVEGTEGDDGNRFLIAVTRESRRNIPFPGTEIFSFAPTIHLPRDDVFAEIRFFAPADVQEITINNFDLANAFIGLDTAFRANLPIQTSGQNLWAKTTVQLDKNETGRAVAIRFAGGEEMPNDATFYVTDNKDIFLPIQLPVSLQKPNERPMPRIKLDLLADCSAFLFDGSETLDPEGDPLRFFWNFGDNSKDEGMRITHRYEKPGKYEASVIIEDNCGQVNNGIIHGFTVTVNHPPKADAGPDVVAAPGDKLNFDGSLSSDADGKIINYYWDFGDGNKAHGVNAEHIFRHPDFYTVGLRVEDNSGTSCNFAVDECEVWINASPVLELGGDRIASVGEEISLSGENSSDSDGKIIVYDWDLGDGSKSSEMNIVHAYEKSGIYKVKLKITDNSQAKNRFASDTLKVFVNDPPVANAGGDYKGAVGEAIAFDGSRSSDSDGKLIEFEWDFGDGKKGQGAKVKHAYQKPGTYGVTLTVKDDSGSASDTAQDETTAVINYPPTAEAGPDQWVTSSEVHFDGSGSEDIDGELIEYSWDFGDGSVGTGVSPVHVYQNPGTYTVRLTVTDNSGTSSSRASDEMTVTVNHLPIADAGPDRVAVPGQSLVFDGSGSVDPDGEIKSYEWNFGDGTKAQGATVTHRYEKSGAFNVLLTVYDNSGHEGAASFDNATVTVNEAPVALARVQLANRQSSAVNIVSPGEKVVFDGKQSYDPDGKIISYQWDVFKNSKSEIRNFNPSFDFRFSEPGVYTATLTVTDNSRVENSTVQDTVSIRVNHQPVADAGKDIHTNERTVRLDGSASSDTDGDPLIHLWDFGDGAPLKRGEKVSHTYTKGGTYPVILTVDDGTGLDNSQARSSIRVKINEAPIAEAGEDRTVCAGKIVIFDGSRSVDPEGGLMKYHWDFGDGTTADVVNPTKTFERGGMYPITLTVKDDSGLEGGDTGTAQVVIKVVESPMADAGPDQSVCAGAVVQFDGSKSKDLDGLVNHFEWDFGDSTLGGGPNPIHVYPKAGTYRVILMITGDRISDCDNTDEDEMIVTVYEAPSAEFTCPAMAEKGKPVSFELKNEELRNEKSLLTPQWDFGDGNRGQGDKVEHSFVKSGNYVVTLTVKTDAKTDCNTSSLQKRITINEPPIAAAGEDCLTGVNQTVAFDGSSSKDEDGVISLYSWDFGDGQTGRGVRVRHQYRGPGKYKVTLTVTDNTALGNNSASDTLTVTVNSPPKPLVSIGESQSLLADVQSGAGVCPGKEVILSAKNSIDPDGEIIAYSWNFGDGSAPKKGQEVKHTWRSPGTYSLVLEVDDGTDLNNSRAQASLIITVNYPPIADGGADRIVSPDEDVRFDASASKDRDGKLISYQWDFGDGDPLNKSRAQGATAVHRYQKPGKYLAKLTVTDDSDTTCSSVEDIVNIRVNASPVADAGKDREAYIGEANDALVFDATGSHDPDGDPLIFYWDFGDGDPLNKSRAQGASVIHRYQKPGKYTVTLKADDGTKLKSGIAQDQVTVQVRQRR
ncbi:MAG: hypothetical protein BWK80_23795 [Desulfobacteraceae bacterium IS3]|nr:MAG: hypothetical protein BWK80_23795 [Desulfobacteraceae bacterium IS3]